MGGYTYNEAAGRVGRVMEGLSLEVFYSKVNQTQTIRFSTDGKVNSFK